MVISIGGNLMYIIILFAIFNAYTPIVTVINLISEQLSLWKLSKFNSFIKRTYALLLYVEQISNIQIFTAFMKVIECLRQDRIYKSKFPLLKGHI